MQTGLNAPCQCMSDKRCSGPCAQANHHPIFNQLYGSSGCLVFPTILLWIRELHRTFPFHICLTHALSRVSAHDNSRLLSPGKIAAVLPSSLAAPFFSIKPEQRGQREREQEREQ